MLRWDEEGGRVSRGFKWFFSHCCYNAVNCTKRLMGVDRSLGKSQRSQNNTAWDKSGNKSPDQYRADEKMRGWWTWPHHSGPLPGVGAHPAQQLNNQDWFVGLESNSGVPLSSYLNSPSPCSQNGYDWSLMWRPWMGLILHEAVNYKQPLHSFWNVAAIDCVKPKHEWVEKWNPVVLLAAGLHFA